ncbi:MAG: YihY family inner membrane protein [Pseudomonadota bacterium]
MEEALKRAKTCALFVAYCLKRFGANRGPYTAAALSYSTLLALVPLLTVGFAVLTAFGSFQSMKDDLQSKLFNFMLPDAALTVSDYLSHFVTNASQMTGAGIIGLTFTAVLLLNTIYAAFNAIWKASEPRPFWLRMLVFWTLLTLGPLLIGASISLSTYVFAQVQISGIQDYEGPSQLLARAVTFSLSTLGFTLLFLVVPNRSVRPKHALVGAMFAALVFEFLKRGFGLFFTTFVSYEAIYGALAVVPVFLVWMYLSWTVLLLGAELAASLPEWRAASDRHGGVVQAPGAKLALALTLLGRLKHASNKGHVMREGPLARGLPVTLEELDQVLSAMQHGRYVARSGRSHWVLCRDLTKVTLNDLILTLGISLEPGDDWPDHVRLAVDRVSKARAREGTGTLADLLEVLPKEAKLAEVVPAK